MKTLRICDVSSNYLLCLPDDIGKLENLFRFNVSLNSLQSLPVSITNCTKLQDLDLSHNKITTIPRNLPLKLGNLESLCLDNNPMISSSA